VRSLLSLFGKPFSAIITILPSLQKIKPQKPFGTKNPRSKGIPAGALSLSKAALAYKINYHFDVLCFENILVISQGDLIEKRQKGQTGTLPPQFLQL